MVFVLPPKQKPIYIGSTLNENTAELLKEFLKLNGIAQDFTSHKDITNYHKNILSENKSIITLKYKDFTFDVVKNYSQIIKSKAFAIKLPILKRDDPQFINVLKVLPVNVIVNDYKKLSKHSNENINWLNKQKFSTYFLSMTGTLAIISDGIKHKIITSE